MAMSKSSYNYNRKNWEDADFPILCETCLGQNPYLRMMKDKHGKECKICERPFTNFRWMPGKGARYKNTELCQTCAKIKNVCQTCMFDLEYGLPVQVRDHALQINDELPKEGVNRDFFVQNQERALAQTDGTVPAGALARTGEAAASTEYLRRLARTGPYYNRNRPHICSFFVKGECKRGEECPYRHDKPTDPDDPLSKQNIKDRYYGTNDPVAEKLMNRAKAMPHLDPPEDTSITTLYIGNLGQGIISEKDLRDHFYQYGDIRSMNIVNSDEKRSCAFVQYTTREAAEVASNRTFNKLNIKGRRLAIRWAIPQSQKAAQDGAVPVNPVPSIPNPVPVPDNLAPPTKKSRFDAPLPSIPPPTKLVVPDVPPPHSLRGGPPGGPSSSADPDMPSTSGSRIYYPSQDPQRLGSKGDVID